jgi:hypothetical protein
LDLKDGVSDDNDILQGPGSNTPIDLELNTLTSDSEQSSEDDLDLEDGVSDDNDILQEEDDPEVWSRRQLLSLYTEGATSYAESDGRNDLDGVFDDLGSSTFPYLSSVILMCLP